MVKHLQITFKEREKVECGRTLHTVGYTQRDNHSAIVGVRGNALLKVRYLEISFRGVHLLQTLERQPQTC